MEAIQAFFQPVHLASWRDCSTNHTKRTTESVEEGTRVEEVAAAGGEVHEEVGDSDGNKDREGEGSGRHVKEEEEDPRSHCDCQTDREPTG